MPWLFQAGIDIGLAHLSPGTRTRIVSARISRPVRRSVLRPLRPLASSGICLGFPLRTSARIALRSLPRPRVLWPVLLSPAISFRVALCVAFRLALRPLHRRALRPSRKARILSPSILILPAVLILPALTVLDVPISEIAVFIPPIPVTPRSRILPCRRFATAASALAQRPGTGKAHKQRCHGQCCRTRLSRIGYAGHKSYSRLPDRSSSLASCPSQCWWCCLKALPAGPAVGRYFPGSANRAPRLFALPVLVPGPSS